MTSSYLNIQLSLVNLSKEEIYVIPKGKLLQKQKHTDTSSYSKSYGWDKVTSGASIKYNKG